MYDVKNPNEWVNNQAVEAKDFSGKIGGDIFNKAVENQFKNAGVEPEFKFENGIATNLKTGEKINLNNIL